MNRFLCFGIALLVVFLDQGTKILARAFISPAEVIRIFPFLQLVSVRNEGAAFGLFRSFGNTTFIVLSCIAVVMIAVLIIKGREDRFSLSLILGGAIGNGIDRVLYGNVTDFLDVFVGKFHWPAFNVADSALTSGIVLMLGHSLIQIRKRRTA